VFAIGADPVKFGLVASMNRPGGNITGVSFLANALVTKQLELLQTLLPAASVIGVLVNPGNPNVESDTVEVQTAAASLGLRIHIAHAGSERDLDAAFGALMRMRCAGLLVFPDALFVSARERVVALAAGHRLPSLYTNRLYVEAGGLMSYGSNVADAFRQMGDYAGRILKGASPADLPVAQSTKFELVINMKTATALGIEVPLSMQMLTDEVIE
jgi:putative ABC transport system substrate-binding protein